MKQTKEGYLKEYLVDDQAHGYAEPNVQHRDSAQEEALEMDCDIEPDEGQAGKAQVHVLVDLTHDDVLTDLFTQGNDLDVAFGEEGVFLSQIEGEEAEIQVSLFLLGFCQKDGS